MGFSYRYAFNGKEKDDEVKGSGNSYDYGKRIFDPRLGRFLSVDPLFRDFVWNSTYSYAENDVIRSTDLDGAEKNFVVQYKDKSGALLWHTVPYSKIHPGVENGPLGKGDYLYTRDPKTNQFSGHYSETYEEANPLRSTLQAGDKKYEGKKGFKQLGKDLSSTSTYVKAGGIVVIGIGALTLQPEIVAGGVGIYEAGGTIGTVGTGVEVISDLSEGKKLEAGAKVIGAVAGKVVGDAVGGSVAPQAQKIVGKILADEAVDSATEKVVESVKKEEKPKEQLK